MLLYQLCIVVDGVEAVECGAAVCGGRADCRATVGQAVAEPLHSQADVSRVHTDADVCLVLAAHCESTTYNTTNHLYYLCIYVLLNLTEGAAMYPGVHLRGEGCIPGGLG